MVIKNVVFQGNLKNNCLKISVDERFCLLRSGTWRFRLDSLFVSIKSEIKTFISVGCSLVRSPQEVNQKTVTGYMPLLVSVLAKTAGVSVFPCMGTLLAPGSQCSWSEFNIGAQEFELDFKAISANNQPLQFDFFVTGLIQFENLDP